MGKLWSHLLRRSGVFAAMICAIGASSAIARTVDCETVAGQTAALHGIPEGLMPAIARVETGLKQGERGVRAWPWTLNVQGKGYYFKTRAEALAKLRAVLDQGVRNVDVGCMQINYRWHAENFTSIEEMMSPEANTRYAAKFLTRLKKRHGNWEDATKHYHSADAERGTAYLGRVSRVLARLPQEQPSFVASTADTQMAALDPATGQVAGQATAKVARRSGVLAVSDYALIAVPGSAASGRGVVLPDSPLPQFSALQAKQQRRSRQRLRSAASTNRQDLIAQLRAEFAGTL